MSYSKRVLNLIKRKLFPPTVYNLRDAFVSPLTLSYLKKNVYNRDVLLLSIPIGKCRTPIYSNLDKDINPYVKTLIEFKKNNKIPYEDTALKKFYDEVQPKNSAEVFGIDNYVLSKLPSYQYTFPWLAESFEDVLKRRKAVALSENYKAIKEKITIEEGGHTDFGPVTKIKGNIEFQRLCQIYKSINRSGYKEYPKKPDGGIMGYFLLDEDDWCFMVTSGKHRVYALSALGYQKIPVLVAPKLNLLKSLRDLKSWPHVESEILSEHQAKKIFFDVLKTRNQSSN